MRILCFGDIHGRLYHLLSMARELAKAYSADMTLQVGDLGLFRSRDELDEATIRFAESDPSELHTIDYLRGSGAYTQIRDLVRSGFRIGFIRGNHENQSLLPSGNEPFVHPDDPYGMLEYFPDGCIVERNGYRLAFLGGVDTDPQDPTSISGDAVAALSGKTVDVLFTHDGPFGFSMGFRGQLQGSRRITALLESLQPRWHVFGHYHIATGPWRVGHTTSCSLACLMLPKRRNPAVDINPGCVGLLDLARQDFSLLSVAHFAALRRDDPIERVLEFRL